MIRAECGHVWMVRHERLAAAMLCAAILLGAGAARATDSALPGGLVGYDYWSESRFLVDVPGASGSLAAGFFNPAAWPLRPGGLFLAWQRPEAQNGNDANDRDGDWISALSMRGLAFGTRRFDPDETEARGCPWNEYTVGVGGGTRAQGLGASYSWSRDANGDPVRHPRLTVGMIRRWRPFSCGLSSAWDLEQEGYQVQADVGLRPLGPRVTLFAEAACGKDQDFDQIRTGYGVEVLPLRGIALGAKAFNTGEFGVRLRLDLSPGFHPDARVHLDDDGHHAATTYAVETVLDAPALCLGPRGRSYPEMDLKGPIAYQRYRFFDKRRTLMGTLRQIDACASDPRIGGVVLNLSGMQIGPESAYELRDQLAGLRAQGKKVIVYFDRLGLSGYALASVADQIWMDPAGDLEVPGLAMGRTYLRGTLDKLGLGVDEWRFFTYKSAFEGLSRTSMSDADREQWRDLIDDFYQTIAQAVTTSRGISREAWDRIVDEKAYLLPREALESGLVDSLGTFEQAKKAARKAEVRRTGDPSAAALTQLTGDPVWGPMEWGERERIALLYAIGPCDMDTGIRGRLLSRKIKAAREDRSVKAVVLRADSPGGDALPSDLVAREMKETAKKKPVIVSQGWVAGSGGYWISMYGDTIVASPITVTGAVGVIGGWIWNAGLGAKLGITFDGVKRGQHADLGQGMTLPLVDQVVPERPLTPEERTRMEQMIRTLYADFVKKVAEGRQMTEEQVDRVGQGRIWSGTRGKEKGLVDEIGGLWRSLVIAKAAAGIPASRPIEITEGPGIGTFNLSLPRPKLFGMLGLTGGEETERTSSRAEPLRAVAALEAAAGTPLGLPDAERVYLEYVLRSRGRPLLMTEPFRIADGGEE